MHTLLVIYTHYQYQYRASHKKILLCSDSKTSLSGLNKMKHFHSRNYLHINNVGDNASNCQGARRQWEDCDTRRSLGVPAVADLIVCLLCVRDGCSHQSCRRLASRYHLVPMICAAIFIRGTNECFVGLNPAIGHSKVFFATVRAIIRLEQTQGIEIIILRTGRSKSRYFVTARECLRVVDALVSASQPSGVGYTGNLCIVRSIASCVVCCCPSMWEEKKGI